MANRIDWGKIKPPPGSQLNSAHHLSQGLIGSWLFNERGGSKILDISGRNITGTLTNGPVWNNEAITFDGANDYIDLGTPALLNFERTDKFSVSVWINSSSISTQQAIIGNQDSSAGYKGWLLGLNNSKLDFYIRNTFIGQNEIEIVSTVSLNSNQWYHLVMTYDGSSTAAGTKAYLNGINVSQTVYDNLSATSQSTKTIQIGILDSSIIPFAGKIDNARIYNRTLSAQEAFELYTIPYAGLLMPRRRSIVGQPIQFDAASNSGYQAASSSYSWSHTCSGNNRYLTVGISMLSLAQTVSGITYNGVAMTLLGTKNSVSGAARIELWGLVAPASGSNTIAVTLSGAIASAGNASSYDNVNQTSPTEAFNSAQATNVGAADATVDVTTVADADWCVDIIATDDTAITVGAGQTQSGNVTGAGGSGAMSYEGPKSPAGAVTMSWTNVGALATWTIGSIALRPVGSSSLGVNSQFFFMF